MEDLKTMSPRRKAAIVLLQLGEQESSALLRGMRREELDAVIAEVTAIGQIDPELAKRVLDEFLNVTESERLRGDRDMAFELLETAFGKRRAREVMAELEGTQVQIPFQFLDGLEPEVVAENLVAELPQTIALVLSHLTPEQSATIIKHMPGEVVVQVGFRLGHLDRVSGDALEAVEQGLRQRFSAVLDNNLLDPTGGVDSLVELLSAADKDVEEVVMTGLVDIDGAMAAEVRAKMFVFEDLQLLTDKQMQQVLRQVDSSKLPIALKGVSLVVKDKFLNNLSSRARENLLDEMELLGSVRATDVEESQNEILESVRELEASGDLVINRGGSDFVS